MNKTVSVKLNEKEAKALEDEIARRMSSGTFEIGCPTCGKSMALHDGEGKCPSCGQLVRVGTTS